MQLFEKLKLCNYLKKENSPMRGAYLIEMFLHYPQISCYGEKYKLKLHKQI